MLHSAFLDFGSGAFEAHFAGIGYEEFGERFC
jgi:hypothetical protein